MKKVMVKFLDNLLRIRIGKRVLKTAAAVLLCFIIYAIRGRQGIPFNCAVAAIICMQPNVGVTRKTALNRIIGTAIGTGYGIIVVILLYYKLINEMWLYIIIAIGVILVLETAVHLKQAQVADFACVTFLSIAAIEVSAGMPYLEVLNRVLDMLIGVTVAIVLNSIRIPTKKRRDVLFIADLDHVLLDEDGNVTSYSKVVLNRLIEDGMQLSVSTKNTPAMVIDVVKDIHLNLPVVVMEGCALYDVQNHKYIYKTSIAKKIVQEIEAIAKDRDMVCCFSTIYQDVLLIYFECFPHMVMQEMYRKLRKNPYRNYICAPLPEEMQNQVMYISILDERKKIKELAYALKSRPFFDRIRIREEELEDNTEYSYLRIYNRNASRKSTSEHLRSMINARRLVTLGKKRWAYDVVIKGNDPDLAVKQMKSMYEVFFWEKEE